MKYVIFLLAIFFLNHSIAQDCSQCARPTPINCTFHNENYVWIEGCRASVTAAWDGMSSTNKSQSCNATIPPSWTLLDYKVNTISDNNGSFSVSRIAAGTDFEYKKTIDEAYKTALDIASKISDEKSRKEAELKIANEYKYHVEWYERIKSNTDTIRAEVSAQSHGSPVDRKRGWISIEVMLKVMCIAPVNLMDQIKQKYKLDAPELGSIVDISFKNSANNDQYIAWKAVDRFTNCDVVGGAVSLVKIAAKSTADIFSDQALEICYSKIDKTLSVPIFSNDCRTKFGEKIELSTISNLCTSK